MPAKKKSTVTKPGPATRPDHFVNTTAMVRRRQQLTFTSTKATNPLHPPFERGKEGVCTFFGS